MPRRSIASSAAFGWGRRAARSAVVAVEPAGPCRGQPSGIEPVRYDGEVRSAVRQAHGAGTAQRAAALRRRGRKIESRDGELEPIAGALGREAGVAVEDAEHAGAVIAIFIESADQREPAAVARDFVDAGPCEGLPLADQVDVERPLERERPVRRCGERRRQLVVNAQLRPRPGQRHRAVRRHTGERRRPVAGDVEVDAVAQLERRVRGERGVAPGRRDLLEIELFRRRKCRRSASCRTARCVRRSSPTAWLRLRLRGGRATAAPVGRRRSRRRPARVDRSRASASASSKESRPASSAGAFHCSASESMSSSSRVVRNRTPSSTRTSSSVPRIACDRDLRRAGNEPVNEPCRAALGAGDPEHGRRTRGREQPESE